MKIQSGKICAIAALLLLPCQVIAATAFEECVVRAVMQGGNDRSAAEIRATCEQSHQIESSAVSDAAPRRQSALQERRRAEAETENRSFTISTHQPNYMMFTYNEKFDEDDNIYTGLAPSLEPKQEEMKFQVSAKFPVWSNMFGKNTDMYFGYTLTSWWQLFADEGPTSAPFRETNYEPELFMRHYTDIGMPFGGSLAALDLGIVHQSNGRTELLSRSWNRVMGRVAFDYGDVAILGRLWWRIPEDEEDDDNPGEYKYLGYGDIRASWAPNKNTLTAMWRPGTEKSGTELTWSYPISNKLRVYAQWWYGYGESLIDYDQKVNRFGIGVAVNDFLMRD